LLQDLSLDPLTVSQVASVAGDFSGAGSGWLFSPGWWACSMNHCTTGPVGCLW